MISMTAPDAAPSVPEAIVLPEWKSLKSSVISDGTLRLEPLAADPDRFRQLVHDVWTDPDVNKNSGIFPDEHAIDTWLDGLADAKDKVYWAVRSVSEGTLVGITGMADIVWRTETASFEVTRQLLPAARGKGFGKRLDTMLLGIAKNAGFKTAFADVLATNAASAKSRDPHFGPPTLIHDEDEQEILSFRADLATFTLPRDMFLAYGRMEMKKPAPKEAPSKPATNLPVKPATGPSLPAS